MKVFTAPVIHWGSMCDIKSWFVINAGWILMRHKNWKVLQWYQNVSWCDKKDEKYKKKRQKRKHTKKKEDKRVINVEPQVAGISTRACRVSVSHAKGKVKGSQVPQPTRCEAGNLSRWRVVRFSNCQKQVDRGTWISDGYLWWALGPDWIVT